MDAGYGALFTNTGASDNTAFGFSALSTESTGDYNTAIGSEAMAVNNPGPNNVACGFAALETCTGTANIGIGVSALTNVESAYNIGIGYNVLYMDTSGSDNVAVGNYALYGNNGGGSYNITNGNYALYSNDVGSDNVAEGTDALYHVNASNNVAIGDSALYAATRGTNNIALGSYAGQLVTTGHNNIDIGSVGTSSDGGIIRIGTVHAQTTVFVAGIYGAPSSGGVPVYINANGRLGTLTSSKKFKTDIRDMDAASEALYSLRPVAFRYKPEYDPAGLAQFGLIAEDVEKICPELVAYDADGKPYSVRYEAVNAMLLNEFLKEHRKVSKLEGAVAQQQQEIAALTASVKEQASLLQKVSAQIQVMRAAPQVVSNSN